MSNASPQAPQSSEDTFLRSSEAAIFLGLAPATLANWRVSKRGPAFCRVGAAVVYLKADLVAFALASRSEA